MAPTVHGVFFIFVLNVICNGFGYTLLYTLIEWFKLKNLAPLSYPIRSETKTNRASCVSRALRQLQVFTSSFDWFTGLFVSFAISQC